MMELTKERLTALSNRENVGAICSDEIVAMARQLLASMEQEPVAEVLSSRAGNDTSTIDKALPEGLMLYAAPQLPQPAVVPQPVSAVKGELAFIDHLERIIGERDEDIDIGQLGRGNYDALMLAALGAFRAAMLQGEEHRRPEAIDANLVEALRLVQCMLEDYRERNYGDAEGWIRHINTHMSDYSEAHGDDAYSVLHDLLPAAPQQDVK